MFRLAFRMTSRDWRAGQLRFLMLALVLAVAALSSVGFFADRMRTSLNRDALQLMGAELVIIADRPVPSAWLAQAEQHRFAQAQTIIFTSMAQVGSGEQSVSTLSMLKAVSSAYPLHGKVKVADREEDAGTAANDVPPPGSVWIDPALLSVLNLQIGGKLRLGDKEFQVVKLIKAEPDRGAAIGSFLPRIILNLADIPATNLIQFGSRTTYRYLFNAPQGVDDPQLETYQTWLKKQIDDGNIKGVSVESQKTGKKDMQSTLSRAEQFFGLIGVLTGLLAAVAIALAARRFMQKHIDTYAMLRFLGLRQNQVLSMFFLEFLYIGALASVIGALLGFAAHFVLAQVLANFAATELPAPSVMPALRALVTGMLLLFGFAMPPLLQLRNVPHNRMIRNEQEAPKAGTMLAYLAGLFSFGVLLIWQSGDVKLGLISAGGFVAAFALFGGCAWLLLFALRKLRPALRNPSWRFAITSLQRRPGASILQIVALALGLMALLLLTVERGNLMAAWQKAIPENAPNRFLINIQPEQKDDIYARLKQNNGGKDLPYYSTTRGRLVEINDKLAKGGDYDTEGARRLLDREFNLSTMQDAPADNQIIEGKWHAPDSQINEISLEKSLATSLKLKLGDTLKFDIAGQMVEGKVTSIRKLDWNSMRVNFYAILNPRAMKDTPQTWITAFNLQEGKRAFTNAMTRDYPNITVIDTSAMIKQAKDIIEQITLAVEFLFSFTLAAGILVLYAALLGSQDERSRESGLLRALGATRQQLSRAQAIEFLLIGSVAGLLAASGAAAIGWALANYIFEFDWALNWVVFAIGALSGAACAMLGGWFGLRAVLNRPPLATLREAT